jgi:hypothetical protein
LIGDHPHYQQEYFATYFSAAQLHWIAGEGKQSESERESAAYVLPPPQRRIYTKDLTIAQKEALPPLEEPSLLHQFPSLSDNIALPKIEFPQQDSTCTNSDSKLGQYETVQSLIESLGHIQYMDPAFQGKTPSWNQIHTPDPPTRD